MTFPSLSPDWDFGVRKVTRCKEILKFLVWVRGEILPFLTVDLPSWLNKHQYFSGWLERTSGTDGIGFTKWIHEEDFKKKMIYEWTRVKQYSWGQTNNEKCVWVDRLEDFQSTDSPVCVLSKVLVRASRLSIYTWSVIIVFDRVFPLYPRFIKGLGLPKPCLFRVPLWNWSREWSTYFVDVKSCARIEQVPGCQSITVLVLTLYPEEDCHIKGRRKGRDGETR